MNFGAAHTAIDIDAIHAITAKVSFLNITTTTPLIDVELYHKIHLTGKGGFFQDVIDFDSDVHDVVQLWHLLIP